MNYKIGSLVKVNREEYFKPNTICRVITPGHVEIKGGEVWVSPLDVDDIVSLWAHITINQFCCGLGDGVEPIKEQKNVG